MTRGADIRMEKHIIDLAPWVVATHALVHFDTLERLIRVGRDALTTELDNLHKAMDADYAAFTPEDDEGDYLAHVNDEYIEVSETLPCLYWYSQFLITYSFFEKALNALCMSFQKKNGYSVSLKDMSGQGINRAKLYLSKICRIGAPFKLPEWNQIALAAEVRNAIAHGSGYIDYRPNDKGSLAARLMYKNVEVKTEVSNQEDAQIILGEDFVLDCVKTYRVLLAEIGGLGRDFITPKHGLPSGLEPREI